MAMFERYAYHVELALARVQPAAEMIILRYINHMCLVGCQYPYKMEQSWEWIFLKGWTLESTKIPKNFFFTYPILRISCFRIW